MKLWFYKKEELEENSIYSLKPIEYLKLRGIEFKKKNSMGVRESKVLIDATIPLKALGCKAMKNPDKKVNISVVDEI